MTRVLILRASMTEVEAAMFNGRDAMVVPLSDAETSSLRGSVIGVVDFLTFNLKCLSTLQQVLESTGDKEAAIAKTLHMLIEPARAAVRLQDTARALLGRAVFIGPQTKQEAGK